MSPQQFHAYTPQSMPAMNLYNTPSSTNLSQSANLGNIQHQPQQNQHYQQNMNLVQSANLGQVMTMPPSALRKTLSFQNVNNINLPTQNFIKAKPNPELRKTMPNNPNFTSLRKKITLQTNVVPTLPLFQSDRKINIDSQKKNTGLTNRGYRNIEPFIISPEKNQQNKIGRSISENELVLNRRL